MTRARAGKPSKSRTMKVQPQTSVGEKLVTAAAAISPVTGIDLLRHEGPWTSLAAKTPQVLAVDDRVVVREPTHVAFLGSMAVFGLFHPMHFGNAGGRRWKLFIAYSLCVLLLLFVNAGRMSVTYFLPVDGGSELAETENLPAILLKVTTYCWQLQIAIVAAILFFKCCSKSTGGLASYYVKLNTVGDKLGSIGAGPDLVAERRFETVCLASAWLVFLANGGYGVLYVLSILGDTDKSLLRWSIDDPTSTTAGPDKNATSIIDQWRDYAAPAFVSSMATVYGSGSTAFSVAHVAMMCRQLYSLLACFNRELDRRTAADPHDFLRHVGSYRHLHADLCDLVARANDCVAHLIGVHICYNFGSSMMQAYLIATNITNDYWPAMRTGVAIWMGSAIAIIAIEFAACCIIIEKVQECEEYLERIPYNHGADVGSEHIVQLQLFLNQIKRDRGFSIFGIYPISKDSLLPMIGTWITYFLLIGQSSASPSATPSIAATCNASGVS